MDEFLARIYDTRQTMGQLTKLAGIVKTAQYPIAEELITGQIPGLGGSGGEGIVGRRVQQLLRSILGSGTPGMMASGLLSSAAMRELRPGFRPYLTATDTTSQPFYNMLNMLRTQYGGQAPLTPLS